MKRLVIIAPIFSALICCAGLDYGPHSPRPTDFASMIITKCDYDLCGIDVEFETGLPPPYVVAVFDISVSQFKQRTCPYSSVLTWQKNVRIEGDFCSYGNSFVQVFTPDITNGWDVITWREVVNVTTNKFVYHHVSPRVILVDELETKVDKHLESTTQRVDWVQTMDLKKRREMSGGRFDFIKMAFNPICDGDFEESWGMSDAFYEGRSNMWPIKRLFTPISASDGKVVALDWDGFIGYTSAPESVPNNKLIPKGIKFNTKKGTNP